jgi:heme-degrading monooxygenase HmoA
MHRVFSMTLFLVLTFGCTAATTAPAPRMSPTSQQVIARMWHGKVPEGRRDEYRKYLMEEGIAGLEKIPRNLGVDVLERTSEGVTEFTVISYWPSLEAIHAYAGADIEKTHNLPRDFEFLIDPEVKVKQFEVVFSDRQ